MSRAEGERRWDHHRPSPAPAPQGRVFPHEAAVEVREPGAGAEELAAARLPQPHRWVGSGWGGPTESSEGAVGG